MRDGPEAGLTHIDAALEHGELANYYLAHSARADMYRRLGRTAEARASYEKALALTQQEPERQFLRERIRQLLFCCDWPNLTIGRSSEVPFCAICRTFSDATVAVPYMNIFTLAYANRHS
jgi:tetratricopeptide (TPR) repeat protein